MLSLEYIKDNTIWVIKHYGYRHTIKGSELEEYLKKNSEDIRDHDVVTWKGQPKDLQEFWKAYENAYYTSNRTDLFYIDDFYKEWVKDPHQFDPEHRPVISTLNAELEKIEPIYRENNKVNVMVSNYNKRGVGNHYYDNWINALKQMEVDFDVIESNIDKTDCKIIIQSDDDELVDKLSYLSNKFAVERAWRRLE